MKKQKYLKVIINADDFGMSHSINRAILYSLEKGIVTDTTLMANGDSFEDAVQLYRDNGFLTNKIGAHINLTEGKPLTSDIRSFDRFVDNNGFFTHYFMTKKSYFKRLKKEEKAAIKKEIQAQIDRINSSGIHLTHIDSHQHIHYNYQLIHIFIDICKENNLTIIRRFKTFQKKISNIVYAQIIKNAYKRAKLKTTDNFGNAVEYASLPLGVSEIMVHPDFDSEGNLINRVSRLKHNDIFINIGNLLISDLSFIERSKVELISYFHLGKQHD